MRAFALVAVACGACATTHLARPVGRGNLRVSATVGGPLVQFGAPVPVPISTLGAAYGVSDALDVSAELHPTAAAFGIAGLSGGAAWHPIPGRRAALTLGASLGGYFNADDGVLVGDLWAAGGGRVASWLWLGGGVHNGLRLYTTALGEQGPWAPTLAALAAFTVSRRVTLDLELRWYALASCGQCLTPDYYAPGGVGALGVVLGVHYEVPGVVR
ncbi:MAG: hypothetical protein U0324_36130 [Polyangiales bacterium]